jgi:hypothetical protein
MYPPTAAQVEARVAKFPRFAGRATLAADINLALNQARGDIGLQCPSAESVGELDPNLDRAAWSICLDLAVWYMRIEVERNPDSGAPPSSLIDLKRNIDSRLSKLADGTEKQDGMFAVEPFCALPAVPFPQKL